MTSLNPVFQIGDQMDKKLLSYIMYSYQRKVKERTIEMLELVACQFGRCL